MLGSRLTRAGSGIFWPICGVNTLVWLAWKVPSLSPYMYTYFVSSPADPKNKKSRLVRLPMLLCVFSHSSFVHLASNMLALESFVDTAIDLMGRKQFVGFYLIAGVVSSLGSDLWKTWIGSNMHSLGASGALLGVFGYLCTRKPDKEFELMMFPGLTFSAATALKCVLAFDAAGMLGCWPTLTLDYAAHLSGNLFGMAFRYLENFLERQQDKPMK